VSETSSLFSFVKKGDKVVVALSLAGFTTREDEVVLSNRNGVIELDNGPGNDPTRFDHDGYHLVGSDRDHAMRLELPRG
jgi:hypothetical protein